MATKEIMPILIALSTLFFPRAVVLYLKFLTGWFSTITLGWVWLILGFVFAPLTLLWYTVVMNWYGGVWGLFEKILFVVAIIIDLGGGVRAMRKRD